MAETRNIQDALPGQVTSTTAKVKRRLAIKVMKVRGVSGKRR